MGNQYYGASDFKAIHGFFANYTNFSGYSSRREYWWWQLSSTLVMTVVGFGLSLVMKVLGINLVLLMLLYRLLKNMLIVFLLIMIL